MLSLSPLQMDLLAQVSRDRFVQRVAAYFALQWPAMLERLGERHGAFIDLAVQHAQKHGLAEGPCVARYVNLWFVWGPAFEDKPGFEWARDILTDPKRSEFIKPHQLVRRTLDELQRLHAAHAGRPHAGLAPADFDAADARVVADLADLGRLGDVVPSTAQVARLSCDLDAIDIGTLDTAWRHEYRLTDKDWQRVPGPTAAPRLRIDATQTAPNAPLAVLTHAAGEGPQARLQVKVRALGGCGDHTHPRVAFTGQHGLWEWRGHEATAISWPVPAAPALPTPGGLVVGIALEASPQPFTLQVSSCGLRDHGAPLGDVTLPVLSYPADQWLLELRHTAHPAACRLERDGTAQDASAWQRGFAQLHDDFKASTDQLLLAFERTSGATAAQIDLNPSLMAGQAGLSWGWREGPRGLPDTPVMRLEGWLDLVACALQLQLSGELSLAGAKARVRLHAHGSTPLRTRVLRDTALPLLPEVLASTVVKLRYPFELEMDPIVTPEHVALHPTTPATGAIVGEAGLRAKPGLGGVQLYLQLKIEPVATTLAIVDPVLGVSRQARPLLPAMNLLDWSLG
ncbi:MAG: hypothetical protein EOP36_19135 [Rubrivivax sp.]|nr:MAG: hypothetical protein EOP36_19135 [Rubrivivax sp.]